MQKEKKPCVSFYVIGLSELIDNSILDSIQAKWFKTNDKSLKEWKKALILTLSQKESFHFWLEKLD